MALSDREDYRLLMEEVAPLLVLRSDIESATMLRPTAMMLPLSTFPELDSIHGLPVIRGDRRALVFEPR